MARKFETDYRIGKTSEVLPTENKFRLDVDLRLDAVELALQQLGSGADTLVARVLRVIEQEIAPRAAEIEALLTDYRAGVPAASVQEEANGRQFLTPGRRAAILGELREGVDVSGDTLAKLLALIHALDTAKAPIAGLSALHADLVAALDEKQPISDILTALAGASAAANKLPYFSGPSTISLTDLSAFARTLLHDTSGAAMFATMGAASQIGGSGYVKLPNGIIMQWGANSGGNQLVTFPTSFPNFCCNVQATIIATTNSFAGSVNVASPSAASFYAYPTYVAAAGGGGVAVDFFYWLAIGY